MSAVKGLYRRLLLEARAFPVLRVGRKAERNIRDAFRLRSIPPPLPSSPSTPVCEMKIDRIPSSRNGEIDDPYMNRKASARRSGVEQSVDERRAGDFDFHNTDLRDEQWRQKWILDGEAALRLLQSLKRISPSEFDKMFSDMEPLAQTR